MRIIGSTLGLGAGLLAASLATAAAQDPTSLPVGPCSPYAAEDGDIPSELPGCARRRVPVPGSLADELAFRRGSLQEGDVVGGDEPAESRRRPAHRPLALRQRRP